MENGSTQVQYRVTLTPDGSQNRESPKNRREDEFRQGSGIFPGDVARRVFGPDSTRVEGLEGKRPEIAKIQRQLIVAADGLPFLAFPSRFDAKGTEHAVRFRGLYVEKHQHSDAWVPVLDASEMLSIEKALPTEYLRRLELQNELFGDLVEVVGLTRANRFVTIQPTLRGGEPSENEIRDVLDEGGWRRVPIHLQRLPAQLMGSAWWHDDEGLVLIDARKPNFKKTDFGVLPIDLILADLSSEMRERFSRPFSSDLKNQ
jgi:hypothetical protein